MTDQLWTILEINCAIAVLFGVFKLVQRRLTFVQQRFALLAIPVLAFAAVLLKQVPAVAHTWSYRIPAIVLDPVEVSRNASPQQANAFSIELIYWTGVVLLALITTWKLVRILRLFLTADRRREAGFTVTELPDCESFSFFRFIQLKKGLNAHDRAIVFRHEQLHARKLHSLDLLYFEAIHCLSWFNPVLPFLKKELIHVHEFEVDRILYSRYKAGYMEFLLSYALGTSSSSYLFTSQFVSRLTLVKRIKIMKHTTKKRWVLALALPLAAGALTLVSWTTSESRNAAPQRVRTVQEPIRPETEVDKMPEFKGGTEAMTHYMVTNVKYPEKAAKEKVTGTVMAAFVVTKTGKVTQVTIKKGVSPELDAEAKRVIEQMPDWVPGEKDGKKVDAEMILPVAFRL